MSRESTRLGLRALGLVAVMLLSVVAGSGAVVAQEEEGEPTELDQCTTIDEPGRYVLAEDIENDSADVCLGIAASDVVLDGDGHTVDGGLSENEIAEAVARTAPARIGVGVNLADGADRRVENVTVSDLTTTGWHHGVTARGADGVTVDGVTASGNVYGVFSSGSEATVVDSAATGNALVGVMLWASNGSGVADSDVDDNAVGVYVRWSSDATVENTVGEGNELAGVAIAGASPADAGAGSDLPGAYVSRNNTVVGSDFGENGRLGIALFNATGTYLEDNDVSGVGDPSTPSNATFPRAGLLLDGATRTVAVGTTADGVNGTGVLLVNGSDRTLLSNTEASGNDDDGIRMNDSRYVVAVGTTASENGDDGIDVEESRRVVIADYTVEGNADEAVEVTDPQGVILRDGGDQDDDE